MKRALAAVAAALVVVTVVVLAGGTTGLDNWAIDHVMPGLDPKSGGNGIVDATGLWRPFPLHNAWWEKLLDTYNYPGSVLFSGLALTAVCVRLVRRRNVWPALAWLGAWLAVNCVEVVGKHLITRPEVHATSGGRRIHVVPFDSSYPSGHTARAVIVAGLVAYAWPRLRWPAALWLLFVPVTLVVGGDHTVSDVVGGMLLGLLVALAAHAMIRAWIRLPLSWRSSSMASWGIPSPSSPTSRASMSGSQTRS